MDGKSKGKHKHNGRQHRREARESKDLTFNDRVQRTLEHNPDLQVRRAKPSVNKLPYPAPGTKLEWPRPGALPESEILAVERQGA